MAYQRIILQSGFTNLMAYVSEAKLHRIFPRFMPVPKVGSVTKERAVVRLQATAEVCIGPFFDLDAIPLIVEEGLGLHLFATYQVWGRSLPSSSTASERRNMLANNPFQQTKMSPTCDSSTKMAN